MSDFDFLGDHPDLDPDFDRKPDLMAAEKRLLARIRANIDYPAEINLKLAKNRAPVIDPLQPIFDFLERECLPKP